MRGLRVAHEMPFSQSRIICTVGNLNFYVGDTSRSDAETKWKWLIDELRRLGAGKIKYIQQ